MGERERDLLLDAFDSNWIAPLGPHVNAFEQEFAEKVGASHAVALSSGTAALHLSLRLLGIQPGDEILTSTLTFVATANSISYVGAKPVFIDSDHQTWNIDPNLLGEELKRCAERGKLPKAVVTVDVNGQCCDYDAIRELCNRYEVPIVEDAAEALGASYKGTPAGNFGVAGCFSFNGNKIITTSGGGMLVTESEEWAAHARHLATQARDPAPHYEHSEIGHNYRLSNLLAAIGRGQLSVLDNRVQRRREIFDTYVQQLSDCPGIRFMPEPEGYYSTRWLTAITIDPQRFGVDREIVRMALESENIESRPIWKPMHMQPVFRDCRSVISGVSESLFRDGLCLPSGSSMSDEDQRRTIDRFIQCHSN